MFHQKGEFESYDKNPLLHPDRRHYGKLHTALNRNISEASQKRCSNAFQSLANPSCFLVTSG